MVGPTPGEADEHARPDGHDHHPIANEGIGGSQGGIGDLSKETALMPPTKAVDWHPLGCPYK